MANEEHLKILDKGVATWNKWRNRYPEVIPDLSRAHLGLAKLRKANLRHADLRRTFLARADLSNARLDGAQLGQANLTSADLSDAVLVEADLYRAILDRANLTRADLHDASCVYTSLPRANLAGANMTGTVAAYADFHLADLSHANLSDANLSAASFIQANLQGADLTGCHVYGVSAWEVNLAGTIQKDLVITPYSEPDITVDSLEVAQFVYLLLNNKSIRDLIDVVSKKVVLILGRFTPSRKPVLVALRDAVRIRGYVPIVFDFSKPKSRTFIETVSTLARLARFLVIDVTRAKIVLQEMQSIIPEVVVPVAPIISAGSRNEPITLKELRVGRTYVLPTLRYRDIGDLLSAIDLQLIAPAEERAEELLAEKFRL